MLRVGVSVFADAKKLQLLTLIFFLGHERVVSDSYPKVKDDLAILLKLDYY